MAAYRRGYDLGYVTCRLTAKNRDQLRNPTAGNRVWATFFTLTTALTAAASAAAAAAADAKTYLSQSELVLHDRTTASERSVPRDVVLGRMFTVRFRVDLYRIRPT